MPPNSPSPKWRLTICSHCLRRSGACYESLPGVPLQNLGQKKVSWLHGLGWGAEGLDIQIQMLYTNQGPLVEIWWLVCMWPDHTEELAIQPPFTNNALILIIPGTPWMTLNNLSFLVYTRKRNISQLAILLQRSTNSSTTNVFSSPSKMHQWPGQESEGSRETCQSKRGRRHLGAWGAAHMHAHVCGVNWYQNCKS